MNITWHGKGTVHIVEDKVNILINPETIRKEISPDLVLYTGVAPLEPLYPEAYTTSWPGEYEVSGILIDSFQSEEETVFSITTPLGQHVCILPESGKVEASIVDKLGDVQIILFPGNAEGIQKTIDSIEPVYALPIFIEELNGDIKGLIHETMDTYTTPKSITVTDHTTYIGLNAQ